MRQQRSCIPLGLPHFLIGGAAKSGTTSIYQMLLQHPNIFFPVVKEPFFFSFSDQFEADALDDDFRASITWSRPEYEALFSRASAAQIRGDASTSYLYTAPVTCRRLRDVYGEALGELRVVFVLRNPVDRAYSQYMHMVRVGMEDLSFGDAVKPQVLQQRVPRRLWEYDYIGAGRYTDKLEAFGKLPIQLSILAFEKLRESTELWRMLTTFLDLREPGKPPTGIWANASGVPRVRWLYNWLTHISPTRRAVKAALPPRVRGRVLKLKAGLERSLLSRVGMPRALRAQLVEYYEPEVKELERLLGWDLSHWLS